MGLLKVDGRTDTLRRRLQLLTLPEYLPEVVCGFDTSLLHFTKHQRARALRRLLLNSARLRFYCCADLGRGRQHALLFIDHAGRFYPRVLDDFIRLLLLSGLTQVLALLVNLILTLKILIVNFSLGSVEWVGGTLAFSGILSRHVIAAHAAL